MRKIACNSSNIDQIYPKFDTDIRIYIYIDPQYVYLISARLKHTYASYSHLRKVCEKKKKKTKKFLRNFADSYLGNVLRDLLKIWNLASPSGG